MLCIIYMYVRELLLGPDDKLAQMLSHSLLSAEVHSHQDVSTL